MGYYAVYSRYRTHHQAWGGRFTVSPDAGVNALEGVLESAIAAHGDAVVMWTQEELPLKVRVRSVS